MIADDAPPRRARRAAFYGALAGLAALAAAAGAWAGPGDDAADRGAEFLRRRLFKDGRFDTTASAGFRMYEGHDEGACGLAALALLARDGYVPEVQVAAERLLAKQSPEGSLAPHAVKAGIENGFNLLFLLHLEDHCARESVELPEGFADRLRAAIKRAISYLLTLQHRDGGWIYNERWQYLEATTWAAAMEPLLFARDRGYDVPDAAVGRALGYIRTRRHESGGFLNGQLEHIPSPHVTLAVVSVLARLRDEPAVESMIAGAVRWLEPQRDEYFQGWGYEPGDTRTDKLHTAKLALKERRILYASYHWTLASRRAGLPDEAAEIRARVEKLLVANQERDGRWRSTLGDVGSTALAVLALSADRGKLRIWDR